MAPFASENLNRAPNSGMKVNTFPVTHHIAVVPRLWIPPGGEGAPHIGH